MVFMKLSTRQDGNICGLVRPIRLLYEEQNVIVAKNVCLAGVIAYHIHLTLFCLFLNNLTR